MGGEFRIIRRRLTHYAQANVLYVALALGAICVAVALNISASRATISTVPMSKVIMDARSGKLVEIVVRPRYIDALYLDGSRVRAASSETINLPQLLLQNGNTNLPTISYVHPGYISRIITASISTAVSLVLPLIVVLLLTRVLGINLLATDRKSRAEISFGYSRARMFTADKPTVTFLDVAGAGDAIESVTDVIEYLKHPDKYAQLGANMPHGVLIHGPTGSGKTHLAKAIAGEAAVPFFYEAGSAFVEILPGVGASRIRDFFIQLKRNAPSIALIEDIDAFARIRSDARNSVESEQSLTLIQLLNEMDGFDTFTNVVVIATTNRIDLVDPALLRPKRFDRIIRMDLPNEISRLDIFKLYTKRNPLSEDVNFQELARLTPNFSAAHIAVLVNEAALLAARRGRKRIEMVDYESALARVAATYIISHDNREESSILRSV